MKKNGNNSRFWLRFYIKTGSYSEIFTKDCVVMFSIFSVIFRVVEAGAAMEASAGPMATVR